MQTFLDCVPCFFRQALGAARLASDDPAVHERVMRQVCKACVDFDMKQSPPVMGQKIHRVIREAAGNGDPYKAIKARFNRHGILLRDRMRQRVTDAADPFDAALRLAIAGNSIDFGVRDDVTEGETTRLIEQAFHQSLNGATPALKDALGRARHVLFLADNTGEIAFDQLLIEQIGPERVTVAVRGRPVINDATREDAEAVGLTDDVCVIDNGSDAPGTILDDCSPAFREAFERADLIIAKGQGNYESLSGVDTDRIFFLLITKCELIADHLGCPKGSFVVRSSKEMNP